MIVSWAAGPRQPGATIVRLRAGRVVPAAGGASAALPMQAPQGIPAAYPQGATGSGGYLDPMAPVMPAGPAARRRRMDKFPATARRRRAPPRLPLFYPASLGHPSSGTPAPVAPVAGGYGYPPAAQGRVPAGRPVASVPAAPATMPGRDRSTRLQGPQSCQQLEPDHPGRQRRRGHAAVGGCDCRDHPVPETRRPESPRLRTGRPQPADCPRAQSEIPRRSTDRLRRLGRHGPSRRAKEHCAKTGDPRWLDRRDDARGRRSRSDGEPGPARSGDGLATLVCRPVAGENRNAHGTHLQPAEHKPAAGLAARRDARSEIDARCRFGFADFPRRPDAWAAGRSETSAPIARVQTGDVGHDTGTDGTAQANGIGSTAEADRADTRRSQRETGR